MNTKSATEHRESVLSKLDTYLMGVYENIEMQPESESQEAFLKLISNVGRLLDTMNEAKNDKSFVKAVSIVDELLEKEFFSKIYGPRDEEPEMPEFLKELLNNKSNDSNDFINSIKDNGHGAIGVKHGPNGIELEMHGMTVDEIPSEIRKQIRQMLIGLGLSESEVNKQLGL